ncbi:MAG: flagellar basal body rod protein FlgB [Alphaproteobacteria bacterium]
MDFTQIPLFGMLTRRMTWLQQRQDVLAQNIANADTQQYRPRDLKPLNFRELLRSTEDRLPPATTHGAHLASASRPGPFRAEADRRPVETTLSGNSVVLEEELMKVGEASVNYQTMTGLYRRHIAMFRTVLGRNS